MLISQLTQPGGAAKFEFMRLAIGVPLGPEWPFSDWFFTTEGAPSSNGGRAALWCRTSTTRTRSPQRSEATWEASDSPAATLDGWLAEMDGIRFSSPNKSRHYVEKYATTRASWSGRC